MMLENNKTISDKLLSKRKIPLRVMLDVICLLLAMMPTIIIGVAHIRPFRRGFFCNDDSLMHPFKPYDEDMVPPLMLMNMTFTVPLVIILLTECFEYIIRRYKVETETVGPVVSALYRYIGLYLFGMMCTMSITTVIKTCIGRLRPHFLVVCQPNMTSIDCTDKDGFNVYIDEDLCTGNASIINEARASFPSGHSSMAMYAAFYIAIYLYLRMHCWVAVLLRPVLQLVALLLGLFCCASRVSDYKHHPGDVTVGGILGSFIAWGVVLYATDVTRDIMKSMLRLCLPQSHSGTERVPPSYQQMVNEETEVARKKGFIQCA